MKIGHIASEISPLAKVGGLADVVYGLSLATAEAGNEVFVIIPAYPHLKTDFFKKIDTKNAEVDKTLKYSVYKKKFGNITLYGIDLILPHFHRTNIYGGADEHEFFLYFSKAAAHLSMQLEPELIHGHDWQSSFALFELKRLKSPIKSLLTLHNIQYQGKVPAELLLKLGLSSPLSPWMLDPHDATHVNLLKMGIESADRVTTVSKSYHDELLEGSFAFGLEKTLITHRHKFLGLLNGIDTTFFNPFHDERINTSFPKSALSNPESLKKAKLANLKAFLLANQKPYDERITICAITRLAEQKAPHLILYALKRTIEKGGRFILIGSLHGSPHDKELVEALKEYENHPQVICELNTNAQMAHMTYAVADALVVPSLFEPCGLTQLIALRYGVIPMARATGGLKDTVFDIETADVIEEKRNGFTFDYPDTGGIDWVLDRCFSLYYDQPAMFWALAMKNLHEDHSWEHAAIPYLDLYQILLLNNSI